MHTVCDWARLGLLAILLVWTLPLKALPATGKIPTIEDAVGDPVGDQFGTGTDLLLVNAFTNGSSLTVELVADQPFLPPIEGGIFIDTDQNPATGNVQDFGSICPAGSDTNGVDFAVDLSSCQTSCNILDDQAQDTGADAAVQFDGNRIVVTAALADLGGDDGVADIEAVIGNSALSTFDCGPGDRFVESNGSMTANYSFDGDLSSRTLNAPTATETRAGGSFTTENVLGIVRPVRTFDAGSGLRIDPTNGLITDSVYTIQMQVRIADVTGGGSDYVKLVDFGDQTSDRGLYAKSDGGNATLNYFDAPDGDPIGVPSAIPQNEWTQIVLTRDADRNITGYIDGLEQFVYTAAVGETDVSGPLVFFDDDSATGGTEVSAGAVACLRIYPRVLDGAEVAALDCEPLRVGLNGNACAYSTITDAVAAAQSGDEVFIEVGSYNERIGAVTSKDLTIRAAERGSNCTLAESVFSFERAVVDGAGVAEFNGVGGILDLIDSSVALVAVDLTNGSTGQGGLVRVGPGSRFSTNGSTLSNGTASSDRVNPALPSDTGDPAGGCIYAEGAVVSFSITEFINCRVIGPDNGQDPVDGDGGAVHARAGSTVSGGFVVGFGDNSARGGGAIALFDSSADISEIGFTNNTASRDGGAIVGVNSAVTLGFNSTFRDNSAQRFGGGVAMIGQALDITDAAIFSTNSAGIGGGAIYVLSGDLRIRPSTDEFFPARFASNSAGEIGGAIYLNQGLDLLPNPRIQGIEFLTNSAQGLGGALALISISDIEVVDSSFEGNTSGSEGGAVYSQASTSVFRSSDTCKAFQFADPNEYCSQFIGNTAAFGSAISYADNNAGNRVLTTAFVGNSAPNAVVLLNEGNDVSMESVWFHDNQGDAVVVNADSFYGVIHGTFDSNAGSAFVGSEASSLTMLNSIAFGNTGGGVTAVGTGSISVGCNIDQSNMTGPNIDPLFVDAGDGDSHLDLLSPAVDVCDEVASLGVDLEGRPRVEGTAPDMGAFEFTDVLFENGFEQSAIR